MFFLLCPKLPQVCKRKSYSTVEIRELTVGHAFFSLFTFVFFSFAFVAEPGDFPSSPGLIPVSSVRGKVCCVFFFVIDDKSQIPVNFIVSLFFYMGTILKTICYHIVLCLWVRILQEWIKQLFGVKPGKWFSAFISFT